MDRRETVLRDIIHRAGALALSCYRSRKPGDFSLKGRQDFLTEADGLVEAHIRAELAMALPDDGLLGEETGGTVERSNLWVADPIDGTANFARGIDHFCVSMAFVRKGVMELGATFNPVTDELYLARRGHGATKNGRQLSIAATPDLAQATIELGWSPRIGNAAYMKTFAAILETGANIRRGASGALALAWVAEGRTDAYIEAHMNAWDCLAGLLMVHEAGGRIGLFPASHAAIAEGGPIIAAAPAIAEALSAAIAMPLAPSAP
ncbi:inositol monophosphatase [Rhizobium sp. CSW-27]|nr:inositol monophosphatase [Rhizobium sp. CSW-27]